MAQKCDTCGSTVETVKRVVIRKNYDRSKSNPIYNCLACYEKKLKEQSADEN